MNPTPFTRAAFSAAAVFLAIGMSATPSNATTTREVFDRYMAKPEARHLFRATQWELLNTPEDTAFTHFFYELNQQGVLGGIFDEFKKLHDQELEQFSRHARLNRVEVIRGYTRKFDLLLKIFRDTARDIGFSKKAIDNMEIYVTGGADLNAFTVSGNNSRIIVVINTALLEKLNLNEVRAVEAHELGHIRSLHSVKGSMHILLMNLMANAYASGLSETTQGPGDEEGDLHMAIQKMWSKNSHLTSQHTLEVRQQNLLINAMNAMEQIPVAVKAKILNQYISLLLNTLVAENGDPKAIRFFYELLKLDVIESTVKVNPKQLVQHLKAAQMAISRAQEKSSDAYATGHMPNEYVADTMAKLAGIPIEALRTGSESSEAAAQRRMIKDQVERFFKQYGNTDISAEVGTSHPAIALRLYNILTSPSYPQVLFADPFLKLLLLEDMLNSYHSEDAKANAAVVADAAALRTDIVNLVKELGLSRRLNVRFDNILQYIAFNGAAMTGTLASLEGGPVNENIQKGVDYLKAIKNQPSLLLQDLEKELQQAIAKTKAAGELKVLKARLTRIQKLKMAKTVADYRKIQTKADGPNAANRLPVDSVIPSHPGSAQLCGMLLTMQKQAAEAAAANANSQGN